MDTSKLIVVSGLPGCGKSTLAEKIAARLRLPILSVDPIESAITEAGIARSFKTGVAAYMVADKLAKEHIRLGSSVVVDAVNAEDEAKQVWISCAAQLNVPLVVIECVLKDAALHRQRIEARRRNLPGFEETTWATVQERRKAYTPWPLPTLAVEMSDDLSANLREALDFVANKRT